VRILVVSHPPLSPEFGAAQSALELGEALRGRGHEVTVWSPEPLPASTRWWNRWLAQRRAIERFVAERGPFDLLDLPGISVSRELARAAPVVARSTQPELLYLKEALISQARRRPFPSPRLPAHALLAGVVAGAMIAGWRRARWVLCLGSIELEWMRRRFPGLAPRLRRYVVAPPAAEQAALAEVRRRRETEGSGRPAPRRFLWIGRWVSHKGTARLVGFLRRRAAARPEETFTLAGCGPGAERDCPPELLRSGQVRIVPSFSRAELPALLAGHDAGLFTSTVEGWGLCLNEMLEAGLPVFATPAGGARDLSRLFPRSLRPFPPPMDARPLPGAEGEDDWEGYYGHFSWARIAERYEREVLAPLAPLTEGAS
jgi:glycosyltransferase involved in cell wall biosynthesis